MAERDVVLVGSASPIKVNAVKACLPGDTVVHGVAAASGINEQPVGSAETLHGALNRLKNTIQATPDVAWTYAVAMENGILETPLPDGSAVWTDFAWVVVERAADGKRSYAQSASIEFPLEFVERARARGFDRTTVGSVIATATGCNKQDPHAFLTGGARTRAAILEDAIKLALGQLG
eukprot:Amastigsp_a841514_22.p1 type:complete len:178 gc:universal Amastigsp_a841514_22:853-1386(+)